MKKSDLLLAGTALLAAGALFVGCAKEPEPVIEEEEVGITAETDEIFTPPAMAPAPVTPPETVIAVVNGEEIKQENVNAEIAKMFPNAGQIPPAQLAQMQAQMNERVLETLIVKKLLLDEANKENIEVNPDQINETIEKIRESLPPGTSLNEQLAKANMTEESFRTVLAEDLRISNLMKAKLDIEAEPSDEDLQAFYNENPQMFERPESVKASHILVKIDPEDDDAAKAEKKSKLEALREKILGGGDFAEAAKEASDCPSSKQGGDLGTFQRGQMVPAFEEAAFTQEIGTVGEVVETQFGYHIIMVTDHMDAGKVSFDEAKEAIAKQIQNKKGRTAVGDYIETLKESADIQFPQSSAQ
ncbi:MAG: peptidylprolyl isomerase [Kiritimatiellae bacterium]|nr:peptidylprolyl isomerase [Kiritimatiellia bacterium]